MIYLFCCLIHKPFKIAMLIDLLRPAKGCK